MSDYAGGLMEDVLLWTGLRAELFRLAPEPQAFQLTFSSVPR